MMIFLDLLRRSEMREWGDGGWGDGEMGCVDNATNRTKGKTKGKEREGQRAKGGRDKGRKAGGMKQHVECFSGKVLANCFYLVNLRKKVLYDHRSIKNEHHG